jgi:predicted SprT family Zn-dependent metalloprotease
MTTVQPALQALTVSELKRCADKLRAAGRFSVDPLRVRVRYDLRGKSRAGVALPQLSTIRLSPDYFAALGEKYRATVAHEYAHLVVRAEEHAYAYRRSASHGHRWQACMRALGYEPVRALDDEERELAKSVKPARHAARFLYACSGGHEHPLGLQRHRRMLNGGSYLCCEAGCRYKATPDRRLKFVKEVSA